VALNDELQDDEEVVTAAIRHSHGEAFAQASARLRGIRHLALEACGMDGRQLGVIESDGRRVEWMGGANINNSMTRAQSDSQSDDTNNNNMANSLRDDREIALAAVRQYGCALQWASGQLRDDEELVKAAVTSADQKEVDLSQRGGPQVALTWALPRLQNCKEVVLEAIKQTPLAAIWASNAKY
jgi:hypothetical protein